MFTQALWSFKSFSIRCLPFACEKGAKKMCMHERISPFLGINKHLKENSSCQKFKSRALKESHIEGWASVLSSYIFISTKDIINHWWRRSCEIVVKFIYINMTRRGFRVCEELFDEFSEYFVNWDHLISKNWSKSSLTSLQLYVSNVIIIAKTFYPQIAPKMLHNNNI